MRPCFMKMFDAQKLKRWWKSSKDIVAFSTNLLWEGNPIHSLCLPRLDEQGGPVVQEAWQVWWTTCTSRVLNPNTSSRGARRFLRQAATCSSIALGASDGEGVHPDEGAYTPCDEASVKFETESAPWEGCIWRIVHRFHSMTCPQDQ